MSRAELPHLALVGFMAAGKSTLGRLLAAELDVPFVDTDATVVARHGSIDAIFARDGGAAFRDYEFEAVRDAFDAPAGVIALGGGALTHPPTRSLVNACAFRIFLEVPLPVLVRRLRGARVVRPALGGEASFERVRELLATREPLYREADLVVRGGNRSRTALAREVAVRVRERFDPVRA